MSLLRIELFFDDEAGTWHWRATPQITTPQPKPSPST
jgi:hypothetical protein